MQLAEKTVRNYFNFKGRAGIREFIWAHIMIALLNVCLLAVLMTAAFCGNLLAEFFGGRELSYSFLNIAQSVISFVMIFSVCLGIAAIDSRRLHDLDMTSWWLAAAVTLLALLNMFGYFTFATYLHLFFMVVLLWPADKRANRYGPARVSIIHKN